MGNCLVTKLKESVNNDALKIMNALYVNVLPPTQEGINRNILYVDITAPMTVKVVKGTGTFSVADGPQNVTTCELANPSGVATGYYITLSEEAAPYTLIFTDKYHISYLSNVMSEGYKIWGIDIDDLDFTPVDVLYLSDSYAASKGKFNPHDLSIMRQYRVVRTNIETGDIAKFAPAVNLEGVTIGVNGNNTCWGNIVDAFSNDTKLTTISIPDNLDITGEINDLAAAQVANGRTSGTMYVIVYNTNVTDDGNQVTMDYLISKGGRFYVYIDFDPSAPNGYTKRYVS